MQKTATLFKAPRNGEATTHLGVILKEKRLEAGLTQKKMGELSGVSLKAVREIEQGREAHVNFGTIQRIMNYFGLVLVTAADNSLKKPPLRIIPRDELMEKLHSIRLATEKPFGIQSMKLFGSYSRNEAREDSDVDVLIKPSRSLSFKEIVTIEKIFESILGGIKTDIVIDSEMAPHIRETAKKDFIDV